VTDPIPIEPLSVKRAVREEIARALPPAWRSSAAGPDPRRAALDARAETREVRAVARLMRRLRLPGTARDGLRTIAR
jgi:hypothetical protein